MSDNEMYKKIEKMSLLQMRYGMLNGKITADDMDHLWAYEIASFTDNSEKDCLSLVEKIMIGFGYTKKYEGSINLENSY